MNNKWPGWETKRTLGTGAHSTVYEIERTLYDYTERSALKVISVPDSQREIQEIRALGYSDSEIEAWYESAVKDLVHSYAAISTLKQCPNVVQIEDIHYARRDGEIAWDVMVKMELLTPFHIWMKTQPTPETAIRLGKDICSALEAYDTIGVSHGNISLRNVFVTPNGTFKLGDSALSRTEDKTILDPDETTAHQRARKPFRPQTNGEAEGTYALGLILYRLLNHMREPFFPLTGPLSQEQILGARRRRLSGEPIPAPCSGGKALQAVVLRACAPQPAQRYPSAAAMRDALEQADEATVSDQNGEQTEAQEPRIIETYPSPIARILKKALVAAVLLAVVGLAGWQIARHLPREERPAATEAPVVTEAAETPVPQVSAIRIEMDQSNEAALGERKTLTAFLEPDGASGTVSWKSSDETIATVSPDGVVDTVSPGDVQITATCGSCSSSVQIHVYLKEITMLEDLTNAEREYYVKTIHQRMDETDAREPYFEDEVLGQDMLSLDRYYDNGVLRMVYFGSVGYSEGTSIMYSIKNTCYYDPDTEEIYAIIHENEGTGEKYLAYYVHGSLIRVADIAHQITYDSAFEKWDELRQLYSEAMSYSN